MQVHAEVPGLADAVAAQNAGALIEYFFGVRLRPSQAKLARIIAFRTHDRVAIKAATQVGKTFTVAAALCLGILLNEGLRVAIIAPTYGKTRILQGYVADILVNSPHLQAILDKPTGGVDSLKREATKTRLTFKDGGEIHFHSCEGDAMRLMGFGSYDVVVEEEAGETADEVERTKITRMTSKAGCQRIKIGNPWKKPSHFHAATVNPRWHCVTWDLTLALEEGAFSADFVEERREDLTDTEFQVLYEARFPDTITGALIHESVIADARKLPAVGAVLESVGADIAEDGADFTVVTAIYRDPKSGGRHFKQMTVTYGDAEVQVDAFAKWIGEPGDYPVRYDAIGVGTAWGPLLRQKGYRAVPVKWSNAPKDKTRFAKSKSEQYWHLRRVLEAGALSLAGADPRLIEQLHRPSYEHTPAGKIDVRVPGRKTGEKSPDHADALVLAVIPITVGRRAAIQTW